MLSQRGRYALKALLNLARAEGGVRQVAVIAAEENIPRKFLEGIMAELRKARLVESARGKGGGYRMGRPADLISFGEIIRITDGPLALLPCASRSSYRRCEDCTDEAACAVRRILSRVRNEVSEVLDRTTLADAVLAPSAASRILGDDVTEALAP